MRKAVILVDVLSRVFCLCSVLLGCDSLCCWNVVLLGCCGSSGSYVLMANLYTSLGKWKEAHMMRNSMDGKGLVKESGWSQVEVTDTYHTFAVGNQSQVA